jgi:hypothetical protein
MPSIALKHPVPYLPLIFWALFSLFCLPLFAQSNDSTPRTRAETPYFIITAREPGLPRLEQWGVLCEAALKRLIPNPALPAPGRRKIEIRVCKERAEFEAESHMGGAHTLAAADTHHRRMILNLDALRNAEQLEQYQTLGHEMVHLLLGTLENGQQQVPLWLHEGLAQLMTEQVRFSGELRLAWADILGRTIPMKRLGASFPYGNDQSDLAYAESAAFARFVAVEGYRFPSVPAFFYALLKNDNESSSLLKGMNDPDTVDRMEVRWQKSSGHFYHWVLALTSSSPLWGGIVVLFLIAYWRKRRRARMVVTQWETQERIERETLDPDEIEVDIEEEAAPVKRKNIRRRRYLPFGRRD